jgi:PPK2 family polyphosphate:nucleotide phosphotransferase
MGKKDKKDRKDRKGKRGQTSAAPDQAEGTGATVPAHETPVGDGPPRTDYPSYRVEPGKPIKLSEIDPDESEHYKSEKDVADELETLRVKLVDLQERLYAEHKKSLLVVLQAMDTGGKDGTITHIFDGVNPQGCQVWPFKAPTPEELAHDFLWRCHNKTPGRGMIGIFNRSHYEDVLVVRVHNLVPGAVWKERYGEIRDFERMLSLNDTVILKFYMHISKEEQKRRLQARIDTPDKQWKFQSGDLVERALWDQYMAAYQDAINKCSTDYAPWYVVPANKKWYRNLAIARAITDTLEAMNPQYPAPEANLDKIVIPD